MFGRFGVNNPVSERGDWVVSGQGVTASGVPGALTGWGSETTVAAGTPSSLLLVALPIAAAATGQPTIGQVEIDKVHGKVGFNTNGTNGVAYVAVGIYIAVLNSTATAWSVRDPSAAADANRDDYLYLETSIRNLCTSAGKTCWDAFEFDLSLPMPVRIGGGEALCLTMALGTASNCGSLLAGLFCRSHVRQSA
jgi:hypothetical protein